MEKSIPKSRRPVSSDSRFGASVRISTPREGHVSPSISPSVSPSTQNPDEQLARSHSRPPVVRIYHPQTRKLRQPQSLRPPRSPISPCSQTIHPSHVSDHYSCPRSPTSSHRRAAGPYFTVRVRHVFLCYRCPRIRRGLRRRVRVPARIRSTHRDVQYNSFYQCHTLLHPVRTTKPLLTSGTAFALQSILPSIAHTANSSATADGVIKDKTRAPVPKPYRGRSCDAASRPPSRLARTPPCPS
jgi:hypothetical protein